jgi:hypothetical protein
MSSKIKGLVAESSVILHYQGNAITIQAATDRLLFVELRQIIKDGDWVKLTEKFLDVKARIEKYTDKNFYIQDKNLYLKGEDQPIPKNISKKLLELEASGEDFMPVVRFWKKLQSNPSEASREQLFGFVTHNKIPLTEMGDIVVEKGVDQKSGAPVGELVDCRTGSVDNSIGTEVYMARKHVDENPEETCSHGLHVGAPDYVRRHYKNSIIVVCVVNPRDVVAVPTDYNNTKMRVCRYVVMGYSDKSLYKPVYSFSDFIIKPSGQLLDSLESVSSATPQERLPDDKVKTAKSTKSVLMNDKKLKRFAKNFSKMTGKQIIEYVLKNFGVQLPHNPKSKNAIIKKASKIAADNDEIKPV